jgi:hypothetical protein
MDSAVRPDFGRQVIYPLFDGKPEIENLGIPFGVTIKRR